MLKPHGVDIEYVMANPEIEGAPWYQHYTWTTEDEKQFKKEAIAYLKQVFRWSNAYCDRTMMYFLVQYGLKTKDDENVSAD